VMSIPGLLGYLAGRTGMDVDELTRALNIDSGLQGLSGVGNDMRTVVAAAADGHERAKLALDVFVHRLSSCRGRSPGWWSGLDSMRWSSPAASGKSAVVGSRVLRRLGFLGLAEDVEA
jgi:acetate kinase